MGAGGDGRISRWFASFNFWKLLLLAVPVIVIGLAVASFLDRPVHADYYSLCSNRLPDGTRVNLPGRAVRTGDDGAWFHLRDPDHPAYQVPVHTTARWPLDDQGIVVRGVVRYTTAEPDNAYGGAVPSGVYIEATGWRPLGSGWWIGLRRWFIDLPF